ncbi:MAG: gliding motility-associated C-terminal domain-containing protein [Elusimicrobiota bacterium]
MLDSALRAVLSSLPLVALYIYIRARIETPFARDLAARVVQAALFLALALVPLLAFSGPAKQAPKSLTDRSGSLGSDAGTSLGRDPVDVRSALARVILSSGTLRDVRPAPRPRGFAFDRASGLSNRFLTPNGDGSNDNSVFTFSNPRDSEVSGRIFDLKGAFVADMLTHPALNPRFNRCWDGMSNGAAVRPGIYIYRLEAEGKAFTGTVVVIR